jgi:hypothetical protein
VRHADKAAIIAAKPRVDYYRFVNVVVANRAAAIPLTVVQLLKLLTVLLFQRLRRRHAHRHKFCSSSVLKC